jgi:hypothetical protein
MRSPSIRPYEIGPRFETTISFRRSDIGGGA